MNKSLQKMVWHVGNRTELCAHHMMMMFTSACCVALWGCWLLLGEIVYKEGTVPKTSMWLLRPLGGRCLWFGRQWIICLLLTWKSANQKRRMFTFKVKIVPQPYRQYLSKTTTGFISSFCHIFQFHHCYESIWSVFPDRSVIFMQTMGDHGGGYCQTLRE